MECGDKQILKFYFDQYILNMVYDSEYAYQLLDEEYKEKRFETFDNFKEYVNEDEGYLSRSIFKEYQVKTYDDYKEYICKDYYNNYYIFRETEPMTYTVLLDQYTVNDDIFMSKYNSAKDEEKAQLDLELFKQMINRKDYDYAYEVLNADFKNKYFSNVSEFKNYVNNNWFRFNEFEYIDYSDVSDTIFRYKTEISDVTGDSTESENVTKRFVVELFDDDDGDFCIYFDV